MVKGFKKEGRYFNINYLLIGMRRAITSSETVKAYTKTTKGEPTEELKKELREFVKHEVAAGTNIQEGSISFS